MYEKYAKKGYADSADSTWEFITNFFNNLKLFLCCTYSPATPRDICAFVALLLNIIALGAYTIITARIYKPWIVGYTIGSWIAISQLTLLMLIKFYQNYFNVSFQIQLQMFFSAIIYAAWVAIIGKQLYRLETVKEEDKEQYIVLYYGCLFGYPFLFTSIMCLLKWSTVKQLDKMPSGYKWLMTVSCLIMCAFGAILVYSTK